mgnify:CR=1 FL=1
MKQEEHQHSSFSPRISWLGKALDAIGEKERPPNGGPGTQPTRRLSFEGVRRRRTGMSRRLVVPHWKLGYVAGRHIGTWSDAQNHWEEKGRARRFEPSVDGQR